MLDVQSEVVRQAHIGCANAFLQVQLAFSGVGATANAYQVLLVPVEIVAQKAIREDVDPMDVPATKDQSAVVDLGVAILMIPVVVVLNAGGNLSPQDV